MPQAAVRSEARRAGARSGISLLAEDWAGEMLRLLSDRPFTAEEIEGHLAGRLGRSPRQALRSLIQMGLVVSLPGDGLSSRRLYALDQPGEDLLEAVEALEAWRRSWTPAHDAASGLRRLVIHREARLVGRALLEGPLSFSELQRRIPGLSAGTLHRLLSGMLEPGVVRVDPRSTQSRPLYELGSPARRLGRVTVLGARWRWRWAPERASRDAGDIPGLVHLLAPLAKAPRRLEGACQLTVQPPPHWPAREPLTVSVRVAGGRIAALALQPIMGVQACISASPLTWCDALLDGVTDGVEIEGDATLARGVVAAFAGTIARRADRRPPAHR
jgi:DNA-binding HxlR family transcriptional regulator